MNNDCYLTAIISGYSVSPAIYQKNKKGDTHTLIIHTHTHTQKHVQKVTTTDLADPNPSIYSFFVSG